MFRIGSLVDLSTVAPTVTQSGSATGAWSSDDATSATFTVNLAAGSPCGGSGSLGGSATCTLRGFACNSLKITVAGTGQKNFAEPAILVDIMGRTTGKLTMNGPGGGSSCSEGALVVATGTNPTTLVLACGERMRLSVAQLSNSGAPSLAITFTIEVQ